MLQRLCAVAAAIGLSCIGITGNWPATAQTPTDPASSGLKQWAKINADSVTPEQARAIASRFDVVVASRFALVPHLAAMRAVRPGIKTLVYLNGTYSRPGEVYSENLYSHDSLGRRITSVSDGGVLMHPGRAAWRTDVGADCGTRRAESAYDGCYIDVLGIAPLSPNYNSAQPINPSTGAVWTATQWLRATSGLGARVKEVNPGAFIMVNGLQNGKRYADSTGASSILLGGVDGGNAEDFVRVADLPPDDARAEWMWKADVDMLVDAGIKGKSVFAMTKVWVDATQAQINRIHEYALASFLLGTNGGSFFTFYKDMDRMNTGEVTTPGRFDSLDIGIPTGAYTKAGAIYSRLFSDGLVLVNPTKAPAELVLPRPYVDIDGLQRSSVLLAPNTGAILHSTP